METITLTINGKEVKAKQGITVLEAALDAGIYIPNLCFHPDLSPEAACRLCLVQVSTSRGLVTACTTQVEEGMIVTTETSEINATRRTNLEFLIANHPADCQTCEKNLNCELQTMAAFLGITELHFPKEAPLIPVEKDKPQFIRDMDKCIKCGRCVKACGELRGINAISFINRGKNMRISIDSGCRFCTACVEVCPTAALFDHNAKWKNIVEREAFIVPCRDACPAKLNIPNYVRLIAAGNFSEALAVIREKLTFPASLGRICIHPCEEVCRRGQVNEPIAIRGLRRSACNFGKWPLETSLKVPPTGKKVAIVGSGPAGLSAAYHLTRLGHSVTVFEAYPKLGGMMRVGIPEFCLPEEVLDSEINELMQTGFETKVNTKIESLDPLFEEGYAAVLLATGAHTPFKLGVRGEDLPGVFNSVAFLRNVKLGMKTTVGQKVVIIGGGNVAIDAARTALRFGAQDVTIIYRRTRDEMPARPEEIDGAVREGVELLFLANPIGITEKDGKLRLELIRMKLGEPDSSGRRRPLPIDHSEFTIEVDNVISAIGQIPEIPAGFGVDTGRGNTIQVNPENLVTSRDGVFACGDAVLGPASVIEAIAASRKAADSIDKYLGGKGLPEEPFTFRAEEPYMGRIEDFEWIPREKIPVLPLNERLNNCDEVDLGFDREAAMREAKRCFYCHVRLQISRTTPPPISEVKWKLVGRETK